MTKILEEYHKTLRKNNIKPSEAQEVILHELAKLHQSISKYLKHSNSLISSILNKTTLPHGLYLHGNVGTGKSMLMNLFFDSLKTTQKHKTHFSAFMLEVHESFHKLQKSYKEKKVDILKQIAKYIRQKCQILYIDELYISDITDAMIIGKLFRELMAQGIIILVTSNFAPDELYKNGLQRDSFLPFINLIKNQLHILQMDSNYDYRSSKLKSVETSYYIYKEAIDSQKFILDSFAKLSNNATPQNYLLDCNGRELICPITAVDCAVFSFNQLCRAPLSSLDYLAICEKFNIIIISEIPKLSSEEHNEARRFTKLIDTIYEFKRLLICSAQTEIENIYTEGKWHFEFTRTASRLHEMQSAEYLSHYQELP